MKLPTQDRILLRGIRFHGHHGVAPLEREVGQWYSVDIDLYVELRGAGQSDDLTQSVDYGDVCHRIMRVGTEQTFQLIEALAEAIVTTIFASFRVQAARVRVTKTPPAALVASLASLGTMQYSAVEIFRTREMTSAG